MGKVMSRQENTAFFFLLFINNHKDIYKMKTSSK